MRRWVASIALGVRTCDLDDRLTREAEALQLGERREQVEVVGVVRVVPVLGRVAKEPGRAASSTSVAIDA